MATQKKYICAFCARAFTRSEHKQRHERSHTNEKPFHCNRCTSSFVRRDLLQRHSRTVHNIHDVSETKLKDLPKKFGTMDKMIVPLAKKKKPDTPINQSFEIHDLIHLLSITRKLDFILNDSKSNDTFLIGYTHLINFSSPYTIFNKILVELINYLNQFNNNKDTVSPVKVGIIYSILSLGNEINLDYQQCLQYFIQSWNLLIKQLIPNYNNNNTNLLDQIDILNNLFILGFIYLNFNLLKVFDDLILEFINDDIILNYLDDISFVIFYNLSNEEVMIDLNLPLFWNIYLLLSNYLPKPPKIYSSLKLKPLKINKVEENVEIFSQNIKMFSSTSSLEDEFLQSIMKNSTKSCINSDVSVYYKSIIIATLLNELKNFINGDEFVIFDSKNCLHNSIILINKSFNVDDSCGITNSSPPTETIPRRSSTGSVSLKSPSPSTSTIKLFALFKKNLIINSPLKFHELLQNYIFIPTEYYNWELLNITSQEINIYYPINQILTSNLSNYNSNFSMNLYNYFDYQQNNIDINNNLAIISFPLIFLSPYLNLKFLNLSNLNTHQLIKVNLIIIEWYLIMMKILLIIWNDCKVFEDNYILQSLIFLLLENKSPLLNKITKNSDLNGKRIDDENRFDFNYKWFMILKVKIDSILENWLDIVKVDHDIIIQDTEKLSKPINSVLHLKTNIFQFIDNMILNETGKFKNNEPFKHLNMTGNESIDENNVNNTTNYNSIMNNGGSSLSNQITPTHTTEHQRRANSISLGILQHTGSPIDFNPVTTPLISTYSSNNSFVRQSSHNTSINLQPSRYQHYSGYAPPPPPAVPISTSNLKNELVLPPILPKPGDEGIKSFEPLIHDVQRTT